MWSSDARSLAVTVLVLVVAGLTAALVPAYRAVHLNLAIRLRGD